MTREVADRRRRNHTAAWARVIDLSTQPNEHKKRNKKLVARTGAGKQPRIAADTEKRKANRDE
jgi:hypothetical protein